MAPSVIAPHVAFALNDAPFFLSHRLPLALRLRQLGFRVSLLAPPHAEARRTLAALDIEHHPWHVNRRGTNPLRETAAVLALARTLKRLAPDLLHNVTQKPVLYGSFAARIAGVRRVVNAVSGLGYAFTEGSGGGTGLGRFMLAMHRRCHARPQTRTIFQNPDDLASFVGQGIVPPSQARLIRGSGVDPESLRPARELPQTPAIVLPARMLADKGIGEAIEAIRFLNSKGIKAKLFLAGGLDPGNPAAIFEQHLRAWESSGFCQWLGHVHDMTGLLQQMRICCLPSYREGLPKALIEAASCGLPIVTCDVPGCREIVRHADNGLLVPPRDPQALAAALKMLIEDYDLCVRMGRRGRERVLGEFSLDRVIQQHTEIYHELLADRWPMCGSI